MERTRQHTYLGIDLNYWVKGEVTISMVPYMQEIVGRFPEDLNGRTAKTPAGCSM